MDVTLPWSITAPLAPGSNVTARFTPASGVLHFFGVFSANQPINVAVVVDTTPWVCVSSEFNLLFTIILSLPPGTR